MSFKNILCNTDTIIIEFRIKEISSDEYVYSSVEYLYSSPVAEILSVQGENYNPDKPVVIYPSTQQFLVDLKAYAKIWKRITIRYRRRFLAMQEFISLN